MGLGSCGVFRLSVGSPRGLGSYGVVDLSVGGAGELFTGDRRLIDVASLACLWQNPDSAANCHFTKYEFCVEYAVSLGAACSRAKQTLN